jgi:hypothetical protein
MNIPNIKSIVSIQSPHSGRRVLPALLLVALAVALLAGSALAAKLVKNGSFEKDSNGDGIPNNWIDSSTGILPKRVCNQAYAGSCSFKFVFDASSKEVIQIISISGSSGDTYKLTFWMKGKEITGGGVVRFDITFLPSGPLNYIYGAGGSSPWTKYSLTTDTTGDFTSIRIEIKGNEDSGKAWFDRVKLIEVP